MSREIQRAEDMKDQQHAPFQIRLLDEASPLYQLQALLPASYRTGPDNADLAAPRSNSVFIEKELELGRLVDLSAWLWVAGRPVPPHPLHHQQLLSREIVVAEQMDLHLVWTSGRIYIKPLPPFLLEPCVWDENLACLEKCCCSPTNKTFCGRQRLRRCAIGVLFSYAALIRYKSDFFLAIEKNLLPDKIDWASWRTFIAELMEKRIYDQVDERFYYGELRLSRLNKLQYLATGTAYMPFWNRYGDFFRDNFTWLASTTVYIAVVLTAMQVGLATSLGANETFQAASYGFTVFSILGPLIVMVLILGAFLSIFVWNWARTVAFSKKRLASITASDDIRC